MSDLKPHRVLRRECLDERRYFDALLSVSLDHGLLTQNDLLRMQGEFLALLSQTCETYTGGSGSSVPVETAEELSRSLLFTLGIWLKEFPDPEDALHALLETSLAEGYRRGSLKLIIQLRSTQQFYRQVMKHRIPTENELYNSTLRDGIPAFFERDRPAFTSHRISITADYPPLLYPQGYQGLDFIRLYLGRIHSEDLLCQAFETRAVSRVLSLHAIDYGETVKSMVCNLCEPVLACALACGLGGGELYSLTFSKEQAQRAWERLGGATEDRRLLLEGLEKILSYASLQTSLGDSPKAMLREAVSISVASIKQMIHLLAER